MFYFRSETKDEPYAWEAREFLRKKLVGHEVKFIPIPKANEDIKHEIGKVYFPKDDENNDIARELVANGLARVDSKSNNPKTPEDVKKLFELEEKAKADKKGQWNKENVDKVSSVFSTLCSFDKQIFILLYFFRSTYETSNTSKITRNSSAKMATNLCKRLSNKYVMIATPT